MSLFPQWNPPSTCYFNILILPSPYSQQPSISWTPFIALFFLKAFVTFNILYILLIYPIYFLGPNPHKNVSSMQARIFFFTAASIEPSILQIIDDQLISVEIELYFIYIHSPYILAKIQTILLIRTQNTYQSQSNSPTLYKVRSSRISPSHRSNTNTNNFSDCDRKV